MEEICQDPKDCKYLFFSDSEVASFDPKKLTIIQEKSMDVKIWDTPYQVTAAIIGESHFFVIKKDGRIIAVELLACIDPKKLGFETDCILPASHPRQAGFGSEKTGIFIVALSIKDPCLPAESKKCLPQARGDVILQLNQVFPGVLQPQTQIRLYQELGILELCTLHEYASGDKIIPLTTKTTIQLIG